MKKKNKKKLASPKAKGSGFERQLVELFKKMGFQAKRAWGSNGIAMGEHREVDVLVNYDKPDQLDLEHTKSLKIQCKRKAKLPDYLGLTEHVDAAVFREDRGKSFILMRLDDFIERFLC